MSILPLKTQSGNPAHPIYDNLHSSTVLFVKILLLDDITTVRQLIFLVNQSLVGINLLEIDLLALIHLLP